eukprot:1009076_1
MELLAQNDNDQNTECLLQQKDEIIRQFQLQFYQQQEKIVRTIVASIHQNQMDIFHSLEQTKQDLDQQYMHDLQTMKRGFQDRMQCINQNVFKQLQTQIKQFKHLPQQQRKEPNDINEHKHEIETMESNTVVNTEQIAISEPIDIQIKQEPVPYLEPTDTNDNAHAQLNEVPQAFFCAICENIFASKEELDKDINHHIHYHYCIKCNRKYSSISTSLHNTTCRSCRFILDHYESQEPQSISEEDMESQVVSIHSMPTRIIGHASSNNSNSSRGDCPICFKRFTTQSNSLLDADMHSREKCMNCNVKYGKNINTTQRNVCYDKHRFVLDHIRGLKQFKCKYCVYSTVIENNYNHHLSSHPETTKNNEYKPLSVSKRAHPKRRYPCPHCSHASHDRSALNIHIRTHTNEKPFKCMYCDAAFSRKFQWKEHSNMHTGEKPYKCKHCDLAFSKSYQKCNHEKNEHTGWKCRYCDVVFKRERLLIGHRNDAHKNEKKASFRYTGQNWFDYECKGCEIRFKTKRAIEVHKAKCEKFNALKDTNRKKKKKRKRTDSNGGKKPPQKKRKIIQNWYD